MAARRSINRWDLGKLGKKISLPENPTVATLLDYYITDELLHTTVVNTNVYIASKMIPMNDITKSEL